MSPWAVHYVYGWVDNRTLKSKYLIGLGRKEKGIKTLEVQLCEGPFIRKRKIGILRDVTTNILCYKWNIYYVIMAGEQTLLMYF